MNYLDEKEGGIPFTARLMAYYRAQESKKDDPLFIDPFAERLAGDLTSYFKKDESFAINDYPLIRSYYIDNHLLMSWCKAHYVSQIVILGAGLDTRAYRFNPLQLGEHVIYEIDFPIINNYKEAILKNERPLCKLKRVSTDLSKLDWIYHFIESGFLKDIPVFWILEGLVYYLEQENVSSLLKEIANLSRSDSQLFVDVCDPVCAEVDFGPYFGHFKWGLTKEEIMHFFSKSGWEVSYFNAEDYDHGRFVGAGLMTFIHGRGLNKNSQ
jgi:methyltransferase (TIGR00027 family)